MLITIKPNANKQGFITDKLHKYSGQWSPKNTIHTLGDSKSIISTSRLLNCTIKYLFYA